MKLLSFIFTLISFTLLSQQTVEVCPGESKVVTYWVESNTLGNYTWSVGGETYTTDNISITWTEPGTYNISVTQFTEGGCEDTESYTVTVVSCDELVYYVPNSFTPDGDNYNNTFLPIFTDGFDPFDYHLTIYNRWGETLFESYDASVGWSGLYGGKMCQDGIYIWKIDFGIEDGTDDRKIIICHLTLIR